MSKTERAMPETIALSKGIRVPRAFHDDAFKRVAARIPCLGFGIRLKAKDMVEPAHYRNYDGRERWWLGCCVADWERHRLIRVRFIGCQHCSVRYYVRT